jgi:hypothetical protein
LKSKFTYALLLLLFAYSIKADTIIKKTVFDTARVIIKTPSKVNEDKVFKQIDLDFAKKVETKDQDSWFQRFLHWLSESIFGKADSSTKATIFDGMIWIFVIAGICIVIWLLSRTEFTSFLKGNSKKKSFNFTDVDEDISSINFDERIAKALLENDYRLAIRWNYLKQLHLLNQKNSIVYEPYKTNIDYQFELAKTNLIAPFKDISKIYDYVWYGEYAIDSAAYQNYAKQYLDFEKSTHV